MGIFRTQSAVSQPHRAIYLIFRQERLDLAKISTDGTIVAQVRDTDCKVFAMCFSEICGESEG